MFYIVQFKRHSPHVQAMSRTYQAVLTRVNVLM